MIFADTSFFVAMLFKRDRNHEEASSLARRHGNAGWITTNHVVGETWTFLRRRAGHAAAVAFLDGLDASLRLHVVHATPSVEEEATSWLKRHDERPYSYVDAVSFVTMRQEQLASALAFDGDFAAAGFIELRA